MRLTRLPPEILLKILRYLDVSSIMCLELVSRLFHDSVGPFVYRKVYATWDDIEQLKFPKMEHLCIKPLNARGEWYQSPKLAHLARLSPYWTSLCITCISRSSGWLKYMGILSNIKVLEIRGIDDTMREFDFSHLAPSFPELEKISLSNWTLEMPISQISTLKEVELYDCIWDFPNNVANLGPLSTLKITVTNRVRWFAWSERLEWEATYSPQRLKCFHLNLLIDQRVNWLPLKMGSDLLEELQLTGFENFHRASRLPRLQVFQQY